jgi:hypothetical protein
MPTPPSKPFLARVLTVDTGAVLLAFLLAALVRSGLVPTIPW